MPEPRPAKKKYRPQILNEFKYRGFVIREIFNRKTKRAEFKTRFQINNKEFNLTNDTRRDLEETLDEIYYQERRAKANLPVPVASPTLRELFDRRLTQIAGAHHRQMATRIFNLLLSLLPSGIKIIDLRRAHFQKYIDFRLGQITPLTGEKVQPQTVNREVTIISAAWRLAPVLFDELDNFEPFKIQKIKLKKSRRENLVKMSDFEKLVGYLLRPQGRDESDETHFERVRLSHYLQFTFETGFRRKETAALRFSQYDADNHCLRNVKRFKTGSTTYFFPLSDRAERVINARRRLQDEFIFSPDGTVAEPKYKTLIAACRALGINYGRFTGGFVTHDLRHNFATDIAGVADIETLKSLTGHTGKEIFTYLHTSQEKQRRAIQNRKKIDYDKELKAIFRDIKTDNLDETKFIENMKKLFKI